MAKKVKCWVCGAEHDYCPTCGKTHGWKYVADTYEHYQIYMVMKDYNGGVYTKEQATEMLENTTGIRATDDLSWMIPAVETSIREIIGDKEKPTKTAKTIKKETKSKIFD